MWSGPAGAPVKPHPSSLTDSLADEGVSRRSTQACSALACRATLFSASWAMRYSATCRSAGRMSLPSMDSSTSVRVLLSVASTTSRRSWRMRDPLERLATQLEEHGPHLGESAAGEAAHVFKPLVDLRRGVSGARQRLRLEARREHGLRDGVVKVAGEATPLLLGGHGELALAQRPLGPAALGDVVGDEAEERLAVDARPDVGHGELQLDVLAVPRQRLLEAARDGRPPGSRDRP